MLSIALHLLLTFGLIWYQRRQEFRPRPLVLTAFWYAVSLSMSLIESLALSGTWLSGIFVQGLIVGIFCLPAVFFSLRLARRWRDGLLRPFLTFLGLALVAVFLAALFLAKAPWVQGTFN